MSCCHLLSLWPGELWLVLILERFLSHGQPEWHGNSALVFICAVVFASLVESCSWEIYLTHMSLFSPSNSSACESCWCELLRRVACVNWSLYPSFHNFMNSMETVGCRKFAAHPCLTNAFINTPCHVVGVAWAFRCCKNTTVGAAACRLLRLRFRCSNHRRKVLQSSHVLLVVEISFLLLFYVFVVEDHGVLL